MSEEQLQLWVDLLYLRVKEVKDKSDYDDIEIGSYKHGYLKGIGDGLIEALGIFNAIENDKGYKHLQKRLEESKKKEKENNE